MKHLIAKQKGRLRAKLNKALGAVREALGALYLREAFVLFLLLSIVIFSAGTILYRYLAVYIDRVPSSGGAYTEGVIGQPQVLNPLYSQSSVADRSISSLVYSGLVKVSETGDIVSDLAEKWEVSPDATKYTFYLKKNVLWHDGEKLLAPDVFFTFSTIQDPDYQGPLKGQFKGVGIDIINDNTVSFTLPKADKTFINKMTLGIIPQHRWARYSILDSPYAEENLHPVGSGMFSFKDITTDDSGKMVNMVLERNNDYYGKKPYLDSVIFKFYSNAGEIKASLTKKEIDASSDIDSTSYRDLEKIARFRFYSYRTLGYRAIFFNQDKNQLFSNKDIRKALGFCVDKKGIVENVDYKKAEAVSGPLSPLSEDYDYQKQLEASKNMLKALGAIDTNNDGVVELNGKPIKLTLSVLEGGDSRELSKEIKKDFKKIGVSLSIEEKNASEFERDVLMPRNYEMVLLGQDYGLSRNLYPFWHSSQLKSPGLNFSSIPSKRVDALLEKFLLEEESAKKDAINKAIEDSLVEDSDAIFITKPLYVFVTDKKIKGLDRNYFLYPENRFIGIEDWYIKTTLVLGKV